MRKRRHPRPAQAVFAVWMLLAWSLVSLAWAADAARQGYRLGNGYALGNSGLRLGGYSDIKVNALGADPWEFTVDDLSLFISWDNNGPIRFFAELESADTFSASEHQSFSTRNSHFESERFYFDGLINDKLTIRLGKFLTPIGHWNLLHAAPLVWTGQRPVASENLFSTHAAGAMLHGTMLVDSRQLDYAVYGDVTDIIDPYLSDNPFKDAFGGHVGYQWTDNLHIGISFANFVLKDHAGERKSLAGIDALWKFKKHEISSEIVYRDKGNEANGKSMWQGFLQSVTPLPSHWFLVSRYEAFQQLQDKTGHVGVIGLAYRPSPPLVWKLEYRLGVNNDALAPNGLTASFAVLF